MMSSFVQYSCCDGFSMNVAHCGSTTIYLKMSFGELKISKELLVFMGSEKVA